MFSRCGVALIDGATAVVGEPESVTLPTDELLVDDEDEEVVDVVEELDVDEDVVDVVLVVLDVQGAGSLHEVDVVVCVLVHGAGSVDEVEV